ncbi:MAG: hypothetical protein LBD41_05045 [Clostridiales Family XIII bacterium]|jgi:chromosome segregation ATPase|nr:hypothetical protein [Clostridiales Family XIII bacterium]
MENLDLKIIGDALAYVATAASAVISYILNGLKGDIKENKDNIEKLKDNIMRSYITKDELKDVLTENKESFNEQIKEIKNELRSNSNKLDNIVNNLHKIELNMAKSGIIRNEVGL